jgi:hypothetical protein
MIRVYNAVDLLGVDELLSLMIKYEDMARMYFMNKLVVFIWYLMNLVHNSHHDTSNKP